MLNVMQNLSKRNPNQLALRRAIKAPAGYKIVAVDSSQIEARMLAYMAGQDDLVQIFREGRDPYSEMAANFGMGMTADEIKVGAKSGNATAKMYRNIGKLCILSAGYGVGHRKFSDTLLRSGIKLNNDVDTHNDMAQYCHSVYRKSVPQITGFWKRCQNVIELLAAGHQGAFGGPNDNSFMYGLYPLIDGGEPIPTVMMPSGFKLRYPGLRLKINDDGKKEYVYDRIRGRNRIEQRIYSGLLTENIIQSVSFQLMMWQACRMAEQGVRIQGNIHDAWYTVVPEKHAEGISTLMQFWMSEVPSWLPGFPVACEGEIGDDFTVA